MYDAIGLRGRCQVQVRFPPGNSQTGGFPDWLYGDDCDVLHGAVGK